MENANNNVQHGNGSVSSIESLFPAAATAPPDSIFSVQPPSYSDPSQYPPNYGILYPQHYPLSTPVAGYPQTHVPPPGGQPYFPQPVVYPGRPVPYCQTPQPQYQHQPQQVIIMNNQPMRVAPAFVTGAPVSMVGAIVLSCIAFWIFGIVLGGIAFILAMVGHSSARVGDTLGAIRLRNASYGVSIAGIAIGIVIIIAVLSVIFGSSRRYYTSYYSNYNYRCYNSYYYGTYCK